MELRQFLKGMQTKVCLLNAPQAHSGVEMECTHRETEGKTGDTREEGNARKHNGNNLRHGHDIIIYLMPSYPMSSCYKFDADIQYSHQCAFLTPE